MVRRLGKSVRNPEEKDLQLLPQLAMAIKVAFVPDEDAAVAARDISAAVQQIGTARSG